MLVNYKIARDYLLGLTDWTQLPDADLTQEQKDAWVVYRQALRNVAPAQRFPVPPEKIKTTQELPWWLDPQTKSFINL